MKKFFQKSIIPLIDSETIEQDDITSLELMLRASTAATEWILEEISNRRITIFCGPGNNGGDGLTIARLLRKEGRQIEVFLLQDDNLSPDNKASLERIIDSDIKIHIGEETLNINDKSTIIDCLFGTGLNRELCGLAKYYVQTINKSCCTVISIDTPSGLGYDTAINADYTLSFQFPKTEFFLPEYADSVGRWHILDIKLNKKVIANHPTQLYYNTTNEVAKLIHPRKRFSHKGDYGHALLIAGSENMMGAAILATQACMHSGVGLLTTLVPKGKSFIINLSCPEAMTRDDEIPEDVNFNFSRRRFSALGIGPGLGRSKDITSKVRNILDHYAHIPTVIDADALFAVSEIIKDNPTFSFPQNTLITPHIGEFDRLTHPHNNSLERLETAKDFAKEYNIVIVLKGAFTQIINPNGDVIFNTTGNSGMATAGSGDVLCGVILSLLAQGYNTFDAAQLGVGLHSLAGDLSAKKYSREAMTSTDIISQLPKAWIKMNENR